jgi:DNA-binding transcriptional LysR family regulator
MLDVRKLILLREVEARGSIAAAAKALQFTRSAVSQQLSALEAETGVALVDRTARQAELTAAGRLLVAHADRVLAELDTAEAELQRYSTEVVGDLRVGVPFHEGPPILIRALTSVRSRYPGLQVTLSGLASHEGRQAVRLGQLDLMLAVRYDQVPEPRVPGVREMLLAVDGLRVALSPRHPLARRASVDLAELAGDLWVCPSASGLGHLTRQVCRAAGFEPQVTADIDDLPATLALVAHNWAAALVPDLVPDRADAPVRRVTLTGQPLRRSIFLVMRPGTAERPPVNTLLQEIDALLPPQAVPPR